MRLLRFPIVAAAIGAQAAAPVGSAPAVDPLLGDGLRLNQVQVIGTHNSYKLPIDPPLLETMLAVDPAARGLDYAHLGLVQQLDLGVRALELDLYHDPDGGRYAAPLGLELVRRSGFEPAPYDEAGLMRRPGFKVLHVADLDFRSHVATLDAALTQLRTWSEGNPNHLPVVVTMNLKDEAAGFPGATAPLEFDAAALDALDAAILRGLGEGRLVTPDLVRGDAPTLESAVLAGGWPELESIRGRFLWAMDESGAKHDLYCADHPSLARRVMFTTGDPGADESAFLVQNDPVRDEAAIRERVLAGYLVRTRADAETAEARAGDSSRFEAAQRSGAQVISTDYPVEDPRLGTGYVVRFAPHDDGVPGAAFARPNPVTTTIPPVREATR